MSEALNEKLDNLEYVSWKGLAECNPEDSELFYADKGQKNMIEAAKAICAMCTVKSHCLEYALSNNEKIGIWGGLTGDERDKLARKKLRASNKATNNTIWKNYLSE